MCGCKKALAKLGQTKASAKAAPKSTFRVPANHFGLKNQTTVRQGW